MVGAFCGPEKPGSAAEFLSNFVIEAMELMNNGLCVGGKNTLLTSTPLYVMHLNVMHLLVCLSRE